MFFEAFVFGVVIAFALGPIALLIVNTGINRGIPAGLACAAGAATADFTFALAAFGGGAALLSLLETHSAMIVQFASVVLCLLGCWLMFDAWRSRAVAAAPARSPGFLATYLLTAMNPMTVLFFAAWLASRRNDVVAGEVIPLALAVFAGSLLAQSVLALAGGSLRPLLMRRNTLLVANLLSGAGIFAIGIWQFMRA